jgi:predicted NBD/HSP70 family sugar kinase
MRAQTPNTRQTDGQVLLGVDLGGTKLSAALVGLDGTLRAERTVVTDLTGGRAVVQQIVATARVMQEEAGRASEIVCCQIGAPGALDETTGAIRFAPNIPGLDAIDVTGSLKRELNCPTHVENDVAAAMYGEYCAGSARGCRHAAFIALGTGIGCGILADGRILRGAWGGAGEIAYLPIGMDPALPEAKVTGAFELSAGSAAMRAHYVLLAGEPELSVREIFVRLTEGDRNAEAVVDRAASHIARGIYSLVAILDPECVVLGGSIGVQSAMVSRIRARVEEISHRPVDIRLSSLGSRAGLVGAVTTGFSNFGLNPQLVRP